jgi:hypothetical protein
LSDGRLLLYGDTLVRVDDPRPAPATPGVGELVGEYGPDFGIIYIREEAGRVHALVKWFFDYPLTRVARDTFRFPDTGAYLGEQLAFSRNARGRINGLSLSGMRFIRRTVGPEEGNIFRITPLRPADELMRDALAASPPPQPDSLLQPDLVEVTRLDPTIKLDLRYATTNNFVSTAFLPAGAGVCAAARGPGAGAREPQAPGPGLRDPDSRFVPAVVRDQDVLGRDTRHPARFRCEPRYRIAA